MASSSFHPHLKAEPFISDHLPKNILIPFEKSHLSLITWNICKPRPSNGFGIQEDAPDIQRRKDRIIHSIDAFIKEKNPDMICLQEDFIFTTHEEKQKDEKETSSSAKAAKEKLKNAGYEIIHDPKSGQTIIYAKNKFTLASTYKPELNSTYTKHTQKVVFNYETNKIVINNINLPAILLSRQNTEKFITESIDNDLTKERSPNTCSILIGTFNLNVADAALVTTKNQILFSNLQTNPLAATVYGSANIQNYAFNDGAFYAGSNNPFEAITCKQANKCYDLNPETGTPIISTVSNETIEANSSTLNRQHPVLNCGYQYHESLKELHFNTLEEANIEIFRTVSALNKQEIFLKLKESKEAQTETKSNDLMTALAHHTRKPAQPFRLNEMNNGVSLAIDQQEYLSLFLSSYRRTQAFEYIYADILAKYRASSWYQKVKAKKKSFYADCMAEGTSPFQKESVINKHATKEKKSKGAIAYKLAENHFHLNFRNNAEINKQIQQHLDKEFPPKKEKEAKEENKKKWWKRK